MIQPKFNYVLSRNWDITLKKKIEFNYFGSYGSVSIEDEQFWTVSF